MLNPGFQTVVMNEEAFKALDLVRNFGVAGGVPSKEIILVWLLSHLSSAPWSRREQLSSSMSL